ncbi:MAG: MFS transporter [Turicibacter sp.]|nr:MFS transporter [Turicibacter sp.]
MTKQHENKKWFVLLACFIIMSVAFSLINTIHSLFLDPVTTSLGLSISAFSLIFTIGGLVNSFMSPIIGKLISRFQVRIIMSIGAILCGVGFFSYSLATQIWMFYLIAVIVGVGISCLTTIPVSTVLTHWFQDKKGTALGIAMAGAGTGSFVWMQIVSRMITHLGYQKSYAILGLIILVICLPLSFFIIKMPSDTHIEMKQKVKASYKDIHWNKQLILFVISLFLLGICVSGTKVDIQPYLITLGHPLTFNANVGSTQAIFALLGSLVGGFVFDKLSLKKSILIFVSMALVSYVCLIFGTFQPLLFMFAALFGLCLALPSVLPTYGTSTLCGNEHYSIYIGVINMIFTLGGAAGPMISGFIADNFNYIFVWIMFFIITFTYLILLLIAFKQQKNPQN